MKQCDVLKKQLQLVEEIDALAEKTKNKAELTNSTSR